VGSNCASAVQSALVAAGKQNGSSSRMSNTTLAVIGGFVGGIPGAVGAVTINGKTPRLIYNNIKDQNAGTVVK